MPRQFRLPISFFIAILSGCACTQQGDSHEPPIPEPQVQPQTPADTPPETPPQNPGGTPETPPFEDTTLPNTLRIATWNVHNYFDTVCDSATGCGGSYYEPRETDITYRTKMLSVADGIKRIDADVLLLQEIEKESCLIDVQNWIGTNIYPSYAFGETGSTAGLDVAILTRGTITHVTTYRNKHWITQPDGSQKRLARELLAAEITLPNGIELTAFTTHFVSKVSDTTGERRLGEAKLVRELLDKYIAEHPGRLVVFGGDLNDFPDSEQIQTLSGDEQLSSAIDMMQGPITTWGDSVTFDYLFYSAENASKSAKAEVICDEYRKNGLSSSDHCSVKAVFEF